MSNVINFMTTKMPVLINVQEHLWFIVPRYGAYRYALLIDICYRNPMFVKHSLNNLHGQSTQSHFLTLSLNWTSEFICFNFSGKLTIIAKICSLRFKTHFYSSFSFRCKTLENLKIIHVISPFKHKLFALFW